MADAPVCHIIPNTTVDDRNQSNGPLLPSIPVATDMQSALAAINAMRLILQRLTHQTPQRQGGGNSGGKANKDQTKTKVGRFVEQRQRRTINEVTVKSKQDPEMTVTFKRIDGLTFVDSITGEEFFWQR